MVDDLQWNWTMVAMGFVARTSSAPTSYCAKAIATDRARQKMRQTGLAIISSLIQPFHVPLQGTGYDLKTGKPWEPSTTGSLLAA